MISVNIPEELNVKKKMMDVDWRTIIIKGFQSQELLMQNNELLFKVNKLSVLLQSYIDKYGYDEDIFKSVDRGDDK